jgi:hypothetical protein
MGEKKDKKEKDAKEARLTELVVPKAEIAGLFRVLSDGLECGCLTYGGERIELAQLKGLKVSIKDQGETFGVKLKFKLRKASEADEAAEAS